VAPGQPANPIGGNANGTVYDSDEKASNLHGNLELKLNRGGNRESS
jgi:hypothetical protein